MDKKPRIQINIIHIILISLELIFIILIIIVFANLFAKKDVEPEIKISTENESSSNDDRNILNNFNNLNDQQKQLIERALYNTVSLNTNANINLKNDGAKIRSNSLFKGYLDKEDINYINFILDLGSINQSYQVYYEWSDNKNNSHIAPNNPVKIMCPAKKDLLYGDFNCRDNFKNHGQDLILYNRLKNKLFNNFSVILPNNFEYQKVHFTLNMFKEGQDVQEESIQELKDYIQKLGFNPEDYTYEIYQVPQAQL